MDDYLAELMTKVRAFALSLPEASEDFPWGESVVKVKGKIFAYLGRGEAEQRALGFGIGIKLPESSVDVLSLPRARPMAYGMGKHGWVDVLFQPGDKPEFELFRSWILESYRAVAPKKLLAKLNLPTSGRPPV